MRFEMKSAPRKGAFQWVTQWLISGVGLALAALWVDGVHISAPGLRGALLVLGVSAVLGLLNILLKPFLILITLPVTILTLGLFTLVVNAVVLLAAVALVPGVRIDGLWTAILAALVISLTSLILGSLVGDTKVKIQRGEGD